MIIDYWDTSKSRHIITKEIINNSIGLDNIFISAVTQIELLIGAFNKAELFKINRNLQRFNIISIDDVTTSFVVELIKQYTLSHGLAFPDGLIAASSIV